MNLPPSLLESPSFQIERLRRRTRDEVEQALASRTASLRQHWVLACLVSEDAASQSALSESLAIDASDMVRLIDELENRGWAKRERDPLDRRRQIVAATKKGRIAHTELTALVMEAEERALDVSTNKQLKHLRRLANSILDADGETSR